MRFYIDQKVFSLRDRFTVKNEFGDDVYFVEGELISLGKRLHIYERGGAEVALVKEKLLRIMPKFCVSIKGMPDVEIVKRFTVLNQFYDVSGVGWEVYGSFTAHKYSISCGKKSVASIKKAWMSWGDSYEIDVHQSEDALLVLAVVLAIDCVLDDNSGSYNN